MKLNDTPCSFPGTFCHLPAENTWDVATEVSEFTHYMTLIAEKVDKHSGLRFFAILILTDIKIELFRIFAALFVVSQKYTMLEKRFLFNGYDTSWQHLPSV